MDYWGGVGGGGGQRVCWPPYQSIGGGGAGPSLPTPMNTGIAPTYLIFNCLSFYCRGGRKNGNRVLNTI